MTTLATFRLVLFWCGLAFAVAKFVARAHTAGRKSAIARIRANHAKRRRGRELPFAQEV